MKFWQVIILIGSAIVAALALGPKLIEWIYSKFKGPIDAAKDFLEDKIEDAQDWMEDTGKVIEHARKDFEDKVEENPFLESLYNSINPLHASRTLEESSDPVAVIGTVAANPVAAIITAATNQDAAKNISSQAQKTADTVVKATSNAVKSVSNSAKKATKKASKALKKLFGG